MVKKKGCKILRCSGHALKKKTTTLCFDFRLNVLTLGNKV